MESFRVPTEDDYKKWIREALDEAIPRWLTLLQEQQTQRVGSEPLLSRSKAAQLLGISLVTLHDWMKQGLRSHKKHGKRYFLESEIREYLEIQKGTSGRGG